MAASADVSTAWFASAEPCKKDSISRRSEGTGGFSVAGAVFNFLEMFSLYEKLRELISGMSVRSGYRIDKSKGALRLQGASCSSAGATCSCRTRARRNYVIPSVDPAAQSDE
jgi:hypothetical protein